MHQGMGFCIPGNPYVPVDAETAAMLANNPFINPDSYWDIAKWQQVIAVLATSTPSNVQYQYPPGPVNTNPPPAPVTPPMRTRRRRTTTMAPINEPTTDAPPPPPPPPPPTRPPLPPPAPTTTQPAITVQVPVPQPIPQPAPLPPPVAPIPGVANRCGGQSFVYVSTTDGTISSPGYDRSLPYPSQDSCFWQIEAPAGFTGVRYEQSP